MRLHGLPREPGMAVMAAWLVIAAAYGASWGGEGFSPGAFADPPLDARPVTYRRWLNRTPNSAMSTSDLEEAKGKAMSGLENWNLGVAVTSAALPAPLSAGQPDESDLSWPSGPNVVLVLTDQWRAQALSCAGNPNVKTPHLDRLAREGIRYRNAFANCPVCTASRGVILTGKHAGALGLVTNDLALRGDETTIAHVLSRRGYRCGYIGKWHLEAWPRDRFIPPGERRMGFDDFWAALNCSHDYLNAWYYRDTPTPVVIEGYEPDHQTDLAVRFIEERTRSPDHAPFFLFLSFGPPHDPYHLLPRRYRDYYDPAAIVVRPNCGEHVDRQVLAHYYAACTAIDENVGRLIASLQEHGVADNTIVLFTSDHGDMLWSHGNVKKQQPWDESIGIPLIVRYPARVLGGQESDVLISTVDLMPTLLTLMDIPIPASVQGNDLAWSMLGGSGENPTSVYLMELLGLGQSNSSGIYTWRGVRTDRYLYAEDMAGPWLLYDVQQDPYQMRNLVEAASHLPIRDQLARELRSWYTRLDEPYLAGVEMARRCGRLEEVQQLLMEVRKLIGGNPKAVADLDDYLKQGGDRPNRRF